MSIGPRRPTSEPTKPSLALDNAHETPDIHYLHAPIMREQAEPRDGREPVPLWLTVFYGAIVFWAGYYLASYNGGFRPDIYDENRPRFGQVVDAAEAKPTPDVQGKRLFTVNCAACHQQSGQGVAGQFPPLVGSEWVVGEPAVLIRILLHGLQGPVIVLGESYDGNMPAFGQKLDDQQLSLVLSYIRQSWGNQAEQLTPEWIAEIRVKEKARTSAWTAEELKALTPESLSTPAAAAPVDAESVDAGAGDAVSGDAGAADAEESGQDNARPAPPP